MFLDKIQRVLQKFDKIASLQKVQKSHLHIAVSIPLSSRNFLIQKTKKGGGGGGCTMYS